MKNLLILLAFVAMTFTTSCKKWEKQYPEDGERSKLTPEERIGNKWWNLDSIFINNTNITSIVFDSISYYKMYFDPKLISNYQGPDVTFGLNNFDHTPNTQRFVWYIFNNDDSVKIYQDGYPYLPNPIPAYTYGYYSWGILKLTQTSMKLIKKHKYSISPSTIDSVVTAFMSIH